LLHLPGGIQLFLVLHLLLLPVVFYGYREVSCRGGLARVASLILAGVGIFAALLHGVFIVAGDAAFSLPMSRAILLVTFVISLVQFYTAISFSHNT
jgi:hypothetical protein